MYFAEVTGSNLYEWTAATQQLTTLASGRPPYSFLDVAVDAAGDVFALENTPDGLDGTQVEQIRATQGQSLPQGNIVFSSDAIQYLFPAGICVDSAGKNLNVTAVDVSNKCLIDQFGTVYELDSIDQNENLGSFAAPPTNQSYNTPPAGQTFFPVGAYTDPCGNQFKGVSGSLYGLTKDGSGFIYFVDENGARLNKYDPGAPWVSCTPANGIYLEGQRYTSGTFTTIANLVLPPYNIAADSVGDIYLSVMPFSVIQEIPRAYVSPAGPFHDACGRWHGDDQCFASDAKSDGRFCAREQRHDVD